MVLQHHERLDGSGYPNRGGRRKMHPLSLVAAVADTFDAITAGRVYLRAAPLRKPTGTPGERRPAFSERLGASPRLAEAGRVPHLAIDFAQAKPCGAIPGIEL